MDANSVPFSRETHSTRAANSVIDQTISILCGKSAHARIWTPKNQPPRGVILLVHGLGDHGGRYEAFAWRMSRHGWAVVAPDLPGHGRTKGPRGIAKSYDAILKLISKSRETITEQLPETPQFVLGHSMGGNFASNYVLRREEFDPCFLPEPAGLLLAAPMLMPPTKLDRQRIFAAWGTGQLLRWIRITMPARLDQLTSDAENAERLQSDPLQHHRISLYLATQLVAQGRFALDHASKIDCPTLVLHGEDDELIDQAACRNLALRIGRTAHSMSWPGGRHDLLNDSDALPIAKHLSQWMGSQLSATERQTSNTPKTLRLHRAA
ncbi:MAG: lysophospholipase [Planctomycetota bacterium]